MPVALRLIGKLVASGIHAAGRDFVQQRLPDVRARPIDERDLCLAASAELVAELRREFETAGAAADDDDVMRFLRCLGSGYSSIHVGLMCTKSCRAASRAQRAAGSFLNIRDDFLGDRFNGLIRQRFG